MRRILRLSVLVFALLGAVWLGGCAGKQVQGESTSSKAGEKPMANPASDLPLRLWRQVDGKFQNISLSELASVALDYDVIAFGEYHGNQASHAFEASFLQELNQAKSGKVALALEQFERDVQPVLSKYLLGMVEEETFLAHSRPWPNYADYRPMIEYAKSRGMAVVAANCPRPLASRVFKESSRVLSQLTAQERTWVASRLTSGDGRYALKLKSFMGHMGPTEAVEGELEPRIDRFIWAQCIKDDTMAESIVQHLRMHPDTTVFFCAGAFHVEEGLGTVERILLRQPDCKVLVIASSMDAAFDAGGSAPVTEDADRAEVILRVMEPKAKE